MQPALMLLKANGGSLGITEPYQMFWSTGLLSSFLDNTPTYLVFLTTAGALDFTEGMTTALGGCAVTDADGNLGRSRIYGSQYLYRQCSQFYG